MRLRTTLTALAGALSLLVTPLLAPSFSAAAQDVSEHPAHITDFIYSEAPDDHVIGSEDAAITLIVWASVTCSHCSNWFSKEWPRVQSELVETGKLRVILREFPTAPGNLSMAGFQLAACAPTEDYFSVIQYQMEEQANILKAAQEGRGAEAYGHIAKLAGMTTNEAMTTCLRNPDIASHIVDNATRARLAKIKGVPGFLINGQIYKGKQDADTLVKLIGDMDEKGISTLPEEEAATDNHTALSRQ